MAAEAPLALGDRVHNFVLPDTAGTGRSFYHELRGGPVLLLALREPGHPLAEALLAAFQADATTWQAAKSQFFGLTGKSWPGLGERLAALDGMTLVDPEGGVLSGLLQSGAESPAPGFIYLLDPNQRVLASQPVGPDLTPLRAGLEAWQSAMEEEAAGVPPAAPVLVLPNVIDQTFRERLIGLWQGEHREGGVSTGKTNTYDLGGKRTLEHVIEDRELKRELNMTLARRISPELVKVFQYQAPFVFDLPIVMAYQPVRQDFFGLHRDDLREDRKRRFALSLNLNDDFEGGELHFPEYGPRGYKMAAGAAAVFSVSMLHEARPVTSGIRFVLTSFFCDPPAAQQAEGGPRQRSIHL